jgi:hypothetical protein
LHRQFGTVIRKIVKLALPPKRQLGQVVPFVKRRRDPAAVAA